MKRSRSLDAHQKTLLQVTEMKHWIFRVKVTKNFPINMCSPLPTKVEFSVDGSVDEIVTDRNSPALLRKTGSFYSLIPKILA